MDAVVFSAVLIYYWGLEYAVGPTDEVVRGGLLYFLFVAPIAAFSLMFLCSAIGVKRFGKPAWLMLVYGFIVTTIAVLRSDLATAATVTLFACTAAAIFGWRLVPSARLLNALFVASIPLGAAAYSLGISIYSVLPGYSLDGELWWRVSLFPQVAPSAYFALIVLFVNMMDREAPGRRWLIPLAMYFLVFSGLRSALFAAGLGGGYQFLVGRGMLKTTHGRMTYVFGALLAFVVFLLSSQLFLLIPSLGNETANVYLFRSAGGLQSSADAVRTIYRTWIWSEHLRLAAQNPLFGIGTFDFLALSNINPILDATSRGSESFLTGLYARVGLPTLLLLWSILSAIKQGVDVDSHLHLVIGLFVFEAMLAYGSFMNPYDFVFLLMLGLLAPRLPQPKLARCPVPLIPAVT